MIIQTWVLPIGGPYRGDALFLDLLAEAVDDELFRQSIAWSRKMSPFRLPRL